MRKLLIGFLISGSVHAQDIVNFSYPVTKKVKQTDDYFGKKIEDPYRWLEDDNSEETKKWVEEENKVTNAYLSTIPFRDKIKSRLKELWNYEKQTPPFKRGDRFFLV